MKKIISLLIMTLILSGCVDGDRYNFSGSSENWNVIYTVDVSEGTSEQNRGTIKYVGEGEGPETINYKLTANSGGSEATGLILENGVANTGYGACQGCAVIQKDEKIEVEITWDGETENLILTTNK